MTRRIKRHRDFELSLLIRNDNFIRPPRDSQRNWLLNKAVTEFTDNLLALDELAARFVPGRDALQLGDRTQAPLSDDEIMEDWQIPLMEAMADVVTAGQGDILEIGFGRGVASSMIQARAPRSHTIIECNDSIVERFAAWRASYPGSDIRMAHGRWQDVLGDLGRFDGIFFHTYPLNEEEFLEQIGDSTTFADHFFPHAAEHLLPGGIFTYLTNEIETLGRTHQRLLFRHFRRIELQVVANLPIPADTADAWWSDSMVVVAATR